MPDGPLDLSVNEILENLAIRHSIFVNRFAGGTSSRLVRFIDRELIPDLLAQLQRRLARVPITSTSSRGVHTTQRLRDLVKEFETILRVGMSGALRQASAELRAFAKREARFAASQVAGAIPTELPVLIDLTIPSPEILRQIVHGQPIEGRLLKDWFQDLWKSTAAKVRRELNLGLASGETVPQMSRRVRGVLSTTRRHADTIVRTATTHVTNSARMATYSENTDLVKAWKFVATLDARTTDICASNDGKVFALTDGTPPPLHMQCRSTTTPVLKSWKELGIKPSTISGSTRASMNGQVPSSTTYGTWLRGQPVALQNEVLGPGRAALFRRGKVPIERFTDFRNRPLTLSQLEALEKTI